MVTPVFTLSINAFSPHPHQHLLNRHFTVDPRKWECLQESHSGRRKSTCHREACSQETGLQLRPLHRMRPKPDNEMGKMKWAVVGRRAWPGTAWMCKPLSPSKDGGSAQDLSVPLPMWSHWIHLLFLIFIIHCTFKSDLFGTGAWIRLLGVQIVVPKFGNIFL